MKLADFIEQISDRRDNLFVDADLTLKIFDASVHLDGDGQRLTFSFQSNSGFWDLMSYRQSRFIEYFETVIVSSGFTVEVRIRERLLFIVGDRANPGVLSRFSQLNHLEIRSGNLLLEMLNFMNPLK